MLPIPAIKKMIDAISAIRDINSLNSERFWGERILFRTSTLIWLPDFSNGPNIGNTNQLVNIGGNSINQSYPVPDRYRTNALKNKARTMFATIKVARR